MGTYQKCLLNLSFTSRFCQAPVEGVLGQNLIDYVSVISEAACEAECEIEEECKYFTYYWANATTFPNTCFLLTEIQGGRNIPKFVPKKLP